MNDVVKRVDDIGIVALNSQPVFAPDARYLHELMASMERLGADPSLNAITAASTSTLDVDVLAQANDRPSYVLGMHFFSPAHVMRLLQVVRGALRPVCGNAAGFFRRSSADAAACVILL